MRILLISWYFPPGNDIGAVRVARMAEYLGDAGHDVKVLTTERCHHDASLNTSLSPENIIRTKWFDIDKLSPSAWGRRAALTNVTHEIANTSRPQPSVSKWLKNQLRNLFEMPDRYVGWLPQAVKTGRRLLQELEFDLIYASGPPFTTFLIARKLSSVGGTPWIAEYRDGWSRDVYTPKPGWRQKSIR